MGKNIIKNEFWGEMEYKKDYWAVSKNVEITLGQVTHRPSVGIEIYNSTQVKYMLGQFNKELMKFYSENPHMLTRNGGDYLKEQEILVDSLFMQNIEVVCGNMIYEAIGKIEEMKQMCEDDLMVILGKEKAVQILTKTVEELINGCTLTDMRIFKDYIEVKCLCSWYEPYGGFLVNKDGMVTMLFADNMTI